VLTSRMEDTLPHDAAHGLAGGAAGALRGVFGEHALRASFASGLNAAAVAAGAVAAVAGVLVLALVRAERGGRNAGVTDSAPPALKEEEAVPAPPYRR